MPSSARDVSRGSSGESDTRFHVSVICTGNICRSPMAAIVLRRAVEDAGLGDQVRVTSSGTGPWHVGGPAHSSTRSVLELNGYPIDHEARQIDKDELKTIDLVLAADGGHLKALQKMARGRHLDRDTRDSNRIVLFRSLDPNLDPDGIDLDLPDPYGGPDAGYHEVMEMVQSAVPGILAEIRRRLALR